MVGKLQLWLLGGCQVTVDGVALPALTLNKARALLAYLAVTNRPQPRAHLVDLLWTELPESDARRNLRVVLTKLRQAIGEQLDASRTHVALRPGAPRQVDLLTFVDVAEAAGRTATLPLPAATATAFAAAFALYQGDFLDGLEIPNAPGFEEWMLLERERLRQLAFQIGERLAQHHAEIKEYATGIGVCRRLLTLEPWQETVHRRLMTLLANSGQPTAALQQYEQCRRLLAEELTLEPEPATQALYAHIRRTAVVIEAPTTVQSKVAAKADVPIALRTQLPVPTTTFLGRSAELHQLGRLLLDPTCRLLTLVGPGGIGKTRLAQQVAQQVADEAQRQMPLGGTERFRDGIFFVGATALPTVDDLVSAVAATLEMTFAGQAALETQLLNQLAPRALLLVIDNFEHLVAHADRLLHWLQRAPTLTLLVTSRERLNLSEEWLFPVQGLPLPLLTAPPEALAANDAVQLFMRRAQRVNLGFTIPTALDPTERAALIAICHLLEGLPLAIELAAGWARTHSCAEILAEIRTNLDFLASELRDIPHRHRSLRAAFDHSWRLLDSADAAVVRQLVFLPVGFSAEFAQQIAQATPATLLRLVDKSFLQRSPGQRYTMHELLRQYVAQQGTVQAHDTILLRYVRAFTPWIAQLLVDRESADESQALGAVEIEFENLRVIWQWLLTQCTDLPHCADGDQQLAEEWLDSLSVLLPMFAYYYIRRSRYQEGKRFLSDALGRVKAADWSTEWPHSQQDTDQVTTKQTLLGARLLMALADMRFHQSEFAAVATMVQQVLPLFARQQDKGDEAEALAILGKTWIRMGHYTEAEQALQRSLTLYEASQSGKRSTAALNALGILYSNQGHFARATPYYETYLAISREERYPRGIANALNNLASNYARNGEHQRALPLYHEAYALAQAVGEELMIAVALSNLGSVSRALGKYADAQDYYEQSLVHCRAMGERRWTAATLNGLGLTLLDKGTTDVAIPHFHEALTTAETITSVPDLLDALAGLGAIAAQGSPTAEVATLLSFVAEHAVTQTLARQRSRSSLQIVITHLSADELTEAMQQATMLDLASAATVARLLVPICSAASA